MTTSPRKIYPVEGCIELSKIDSSETYFRGLAATLENLPHEGIGEIAKVILRAYQDRRAVFLFGNGGSAALASHVACDLGKGTSTAGPERFRVLSLTDNVPLLTAWANDLKYEDIFAEQILNFVEPGDVAFAISGSGNSPNVLKGLRVARDAGAYNIGLSGFRGGDMKALCDLCVVVPSDNMQVIEDVHLSISHCVFSMVYNGIAELTSTRAFEFAKVASSAQR
jgi:D-sedoheptulose 7-phosphate isomerase